MTTFDDLERLATGQPAVSGVAERRVQRRTNQRSWAAMKPRPAPMESTSHWERGGKPSVSPLSWRHPWQLQLVSCVVTLDVLAMVATLGLLTLVTGHASVGALTALVVLPVWCGVLTLVRAYDTSRIGVGHEEPAIVLRAVVVGIVVLVLGAAVAETVVPRIYLLLGAPMLGLSTVAGRFSARRWLRKGVRGTASSLRTVVAGDADSVDDVLVSLAGGRDHRYEVIGVCLPSDRDDWVARSATTLGTLSDVPQVVVDVRADVVIAVGASFSGSALRRLSWALEDTSAALVVSPGLIETAGPRIRMQPVSGLSLLHVGATARQGIGLAVKTLIDRAAGALLLLATLPVMIVAGALVRIGSPGPALFRQERIGRDGRPFTMLKLRSMVNSPDAFPPNLINNGHGPLFKMHSDPRVTPIGAVLRRYSIDELPQLWNVLRGEMSLVGPRPALRREYEQYHDAVHRRLRVKPGLTGLWQVSGRSDLTWQESVRLDLRYVDNWSLSLDLRILWRTARAVLNASGAY